MKCNRKVAICNENLDTNSLLQFVRARYSHAITYKKKKDIGFSMQYSELGQCGRVCSFQI